MSKRPYPKHEYNIIDFLFKDFFFGGGQNVIFIDLMSNIRKGLKKKLWKLPVRGVGGHNTYFFLADDKQILYP